MSLARNLVDYNAAAPATRPQPQEKQRPGNRPVKQPTKLKRGVVASLACCWVVFMGAAVLQVHYNSLVQTEKNAITDLRTRTTDIGQRIQERQAQLVQQRSYDTVSAFAAANGMVRANDVAPLESDGALVAAAEAQLAAPQASVTAAAAVKSTGLLETLRNFMTRTFQAVVAAGN